MNIKKWFIALLLVLTVSIPVFCAGIGTTGAQFLKIDPAARPTGMAGAYSAVVGDADAVFYNPAGIAQLSTNEISGTYLKYFQAINYGSLSGVMPVGSGVFGMGINYLGITDIPKRSADDIDDPDGTSKPDTFTAADTAILIAYAMKNTIPSILENLDLGVNLKFTYQTIDDESAFSAMIDLGAYYPVSNNVSLAISIQNAGLPVKFKEEADPLPLNFKVGSAYKPVDGLTIACDINEYIVDQMLYASLGAEYWVVDMIGIRAGYKYGYDTDSLGSAVGFSGGLGFRYSGVGLDYTFAPFGELGDTHRVSCSAKF